jgi:hypothetical protein
MIFEVTFDLLPVAFVIVDFFAIGANRKKAAQGFDFPQGLLQIKNQTVLLLFGLPSVIDFLFEVLMHSLD